MSVNRVLPSMFHRRLMLLLGVCVLGFAVLAGQLVNLTVVQGAGLLEGAEAKLVRERWTPTVRGRILDRKNRVLAQDEPSFAAKVKYDVIAGSGDSSTWARLAAASTARRRNSAAWEKLDDAAREELIGRYQAVYDAHIQRMWARLSQETGTAPEDLKTRRKGVIGDVTRQKRYHIAQKLEEEYRKQLALAWKPPRGPGDSPAAVARAGEIGARAASVRSNYKDPAVGSAREAAGLQRLGPPPDNAFLDRVEQKYLRTLIAEEGRLHKSLRDRLTDHRDGADAHTVARSLMDAEGFELLRLAEEEVELDVSAADLPAPVAGSDRMPATETVDLLPGLVIADEGDRAYPFDSYTVELDRSGFPGPLRTQTPLRVSVSGVACHLIGKMRSGHYEADATGRELRIKGDALFAARAGAPDGTDRGRYRDGDAVGDTGVEGSREDELRGLRGLKTFHIDTGITDELKSVDGRDVRLTIDAVLQARIQAVMSPAAGLAVVQPWQGGQGIEGGVLLPDGTPLNGAAVVLDVATGEILAMVSTPTFSHEDLRDNPGRVFDDSVNFPYINKAIARPYPPGSVAKALILCGAVARGEHRLGERIECTGHFFPNSKDRFRCWTYRERFGFTTHSARLGHDPDAVEALMGSCNIFYFTLGRRLGVEGVIDTYSRFGLGEPSWGLGVGDELAGKVGHDRPPPADKGAPLPPEPPLDLNDATLMGIGQGPVVWTPLHAADAFATLAREGRRVKPRVIEDADAGAPVETGYGPGAIAAALEGLRQSVNERDGTGNHLVFDDRPEPIFNAPGVDVWGKTGTAQVVARKGDPDGPNGPMPPEVREGDHSWFLILVGPKGGRPVYSIAVMMEHAGSGGKVSGPIVNQIVHALIAEGYLPGAESRGIGLVPDAGREGGIRRGGGSSGRSPMPRCEVARGL